MSLTAGKVFINLPVKNLDQTMAFFGKIGFEFNPLYTDQNATCMIINENTYAMLLVEDFFQTFTKKELADSSKSTEVIIALAAESKEQVDEIVQKALDAGGRSSNEPFDHGFMYGWSFQDINDHLWEVFYMDENAVPPEG
ncbi:glyoxalase/bleomycin resistance/extradiol dioxygenase family protein [Bacillus mangrovi]|uniref:Glyoxalase/bleomycin resistance/extradiol dioxygenase family protein n=1 Tax=Metabacillus mangrovi TaxID=1491830 RepID=A0A7X2S9Q4_9BACI|nr:VOC family protein [Metabacillus mangrovi]MTH55691.1 glyoxalase/bleomycin resistance/extradiol dioxygenase family protein [Metabacillus mangrovi]